MSHVGACMWVRRLYSSKMILWLLKILPGLYKMIKESLLFSKWFRPKYLLKFWTLRKMWSTTAASPILNSLKNTPHFVQCYNSGLDSQVTHISKGECASEQVNYGYWACSSCSLLLTSPSYFLFIKYKPQWKAWFVHCKNTPNRNTDSL